MERGDIYLVRSIRPPAMSNGQATRARDFAGQVNRLTGVPVVLPITGGGGCPNGRLCSIAHGTGMRTVGVVRCDQPRAVDLRARGGKKLRRCLTKSSTK